MRSKKGELGRLSACAGAHRTLSALTISKPSLRLVTLRLVPSILVMFLLSGTVHAADLRVVAWNLEHLNDTTGRGCLPRRQGDYDAIARQVERLDADIVAFQEVENEAAARRVFPPSRWRVEVSSRPSAGPGPPCWDRPEQRLGHLATGFALRQGIAYRRHRDVSELGGDDPFERWGTDITVTRGGRELRLLSVHLKTGCWGASQDEDEEREDLCAFLREQFGVVGAWIEARRAKREAFVVLGDFNRRLAVPGDWAWNALSPPSAPLELPTAGRVARCDPRFKEFIDHFVLGAGAEVMMVPGSFREFPRKGRHPDHCALSLDLRTAG